MTQINRVENKTMKQQIEDILKKQALSQINTSLIADEVLKVVRQIIEDAIKFQKEVLPSSYEIGYTHALEDLLSILSPNNENEIEEIPLFKGTMDKLNNLYK